MIDEKLKTCIAEATTSAEDEFVQRANELNEAATAFVQEVIDAIVQLLVDVGLAERSEPYPTHKRNRKRRHHRRRK